MKKNDIDFLAEYVQNLSYETEGPPPDFSGMEEDARRVGLELSLLRKWIKEMKEYAARLSKGCLDLLPPSKDNPLCHDLKNLHSNLTHLTWQARAVASGDYSQRVSYMGKFSESFNTMIDQLKEREGKLKEEIARTEQDARSLKNYNDLFLKLTRRCQEWIIVIQKDTRKTIYCNKRPPGEGRNNEVCIHCPYDIGIRSVLTHDAEESDKTFEYHNEETDRWYLVDRFQLDWQGELSHAYIIGEVTKERNRERKLSDMAYRDMMTGIYNRRYLLEKIREYLREKRAFTFCYIDLDHLKYVNDTFGHSEGDSYIRSFISQVEDEIRRDDIFARIGGDEFGIIFNQDAFQAIRNRMERTRRQMIEGLLKKKPYGGGFSYGMVECSGETHTSVEEVIRQADLKMYEYKVSHRDPHQTEGGRKGSGSEDAKSDAAKEDGIG